ncbi:uncharacterized protein LOC119673945 [Teleopsis dalmanni]|uniref:uncharacterized protein LOC119673945 n=1 Tax=Teleopsis dalmanni TaxID=139649 RepID=UPI0018CFBF92|nr:uncharacterized protein LOC119673945 [Teleopsis dalmanni]
MDKPVFMSNGKDLIKTFGFRKQNPPVCSSESTIIRAALKQTINITCQVDANPLDNLNYKWHFNNSLESLIELPTTVATAVSAQPLQHPDTGRTSAGGYYQRTKRKHSHSQKFVLGRHGRVAASSNVAATWSNIHFEDEDEHHDYDGMGVNNDADANANAEDDDDDIGVIRSEMAINDMDYGSIPELPYTQMVYSNMMHKNHLEGKQQVRKQTQQQQQLQLQQQQILLQHPVSAHDATHGNQFLLAERKRMAALHKQQHHRVMVTTTPPAPLNNVYVYHIESYDSFGAVSCVANSPMGQSQPCWYHIQPADLPDPVKNCTSYNATANSLQVQCIPGSDGGIPQHFHVQVYDELNRQILYNTSFKYSDFTVKRLPSDSVFVIRITAVNAQGPSKVAYRLRGRTLSAPLLRTASSTAVLVQLTPLLGALVGVIATLVLVAICIVIFVKFRTKRTRRPNGDATSTEADKGSAEPLSRNMGSHSSLEDKNPDVVPQETNSEDEFHMEEKAFDRLNMESQRILYTPPSRMNTASPTLPPLSPTFGKQYGELSLTTNPAYSLYNTPQRAPATQRPLYTAPPPLLSTRTPPNIYTRIPGRTYLPAYETRTSPTSPYGSTTTCTIPLLGGQSSGSLQTNSSSGVGSGLGIVSGCNTLPHPGSQNNAISAALTSSVTSGNITIGAAQSLLTSPRTQSAYGSATVQSPLLATSALLGNGNYETVSS